MFNFFSQSMHVTNACVIVFLASAKTGNNGISDHTTQVVILSKVSNHQTVHVCFVYLFFW